MTIDAALLTTVFLAGVLSFFSPCVLPLLPVYLGYFSAAEEGGGAGPLLHRLGKTAAFVAGLSAAFFLLGFGAGLAGSFVQSSLFRLFCGMFIVLLGLHQTGLIVIPLLERQKTISSPMDPAKGLLGPFALGFCFSFGWTPCVGPILAMVLGLSLERGGSLAGGALLLLYAAGLAVPFFVMAVGAHFLLEKVRGLLPHLGKVKVLGGILVMAMGVWMIAGQIPALSRQTAADEGGFATLSGEIVRPEDLEGKTVYLKFWATWCPVCLIGMEDFEELAEEYADSQKVAVYSVVAPGYYHEMDMEQFTDWATGQNLTFPIIFDQDGALNEKYGIQAYPTSVYLDGDQNLIEVHVGHLGNDEIRERLTQLTSG